jgi:hypothetical protein
MLTFRFLGRQASKVFPRAIRRFPIIVAPGSTVMLYSSQSDVDVNSADMRRILDFLRMRDMNSGLLGIRRDVNFGIA